MNGIVLSLCDRSGVMVAPWAEAGYECWTVDLQNERGERRATSDLCQRCGHPQRRHYLGRSGSCECTCELWEAPTCGARVQVGADVLSWLPPMREVAIVFAFPPCTHMAVSGARWFRSKGLRLAAEAFLIADRCREIAERSGAPWMLENPVSTLATYWRKPDHTFDPCDFGGYLNPPGDSYEKKTCLWTGGGFVMPQPKPVAITHAPGSSPIHRMAPSEDRGHLRSLTPAGFARAVFEANAPAIARRTA